MKLIHLPTGNTLSLEKTPAWKAMLADHPQVYIRSELPKHWRVEGYDKSWEWLFKKPWSSETKWEWVSNIRLGTILAEASAGFNTSHPMSNKLPQISRAEFEYHVYDRWKMRIQNHLEAEPFADECSQDLLERAYGASRLSSLKRAYEKYEKTSFTHGQEKELAKILFRSPIEALGSSFESDVKAVLNTIESLLVSKNKAYGNAALDPMRIFSKADSTDGLLLRIDDKLNRIKNVGITPETEDSVMDLIGYLVLLKISQANANTKPEPSAPKEEDNSVPISSEKVRAVLLNVGTSNLPNWITTNTVSGADRSGSEQSGKPF